MRKVLIADDEVSLRVLVSATLMSDDYQLLEAADGDQAWALIQQHRPEVTLLDVQMPGRTGLDLARAIKQDPVLCRTYVILLTAKAQEADVAAGREAGADQYLTKPFSPLELLSVLEHALEAA